MIALSFVLHGEISSVMLWKKRAKVKVESLRVYSGAIGKTHKPKRVSTWWSAMTNIPLFIILLTNSSHIETFGSIIYTWLVQAQSQQLGQIS